MDEERPAGALVIVAVASAIWPFPQQLCQPSGSPDAGQQTDQDGP